MSQATSRIGASRVATLVHGFDTSPAYLGLATALQHLIGEGRISLDIRLPSERELTTVLGVSRTTVTRAYAQLCEAGYARARHGSGTYTQVPTGSRRIVDNTLLPYAGDADAIDLNCAAPMSPPGLASAYADATEELPAYLGGHGYFPAGLPQLRAAIAQSYVDRGLVTRPEEILVTPGGLSGTRLVAEALLGRGDRVVVEDPLYPNATEALRQRGARLVPNVVDPDGWDLEATDALLTSARPRASFMIPDFQNPTGHLMGDEQRAGLAASLRAAGTFAIVDEAHQALLLDDVAMPAPFAAHLSGTISIGSSSKAYWGGLRLGWIRAEETTLDRISRIRRAIDLGTPVLEQLVLTRLLTTHQDVLRHNRERLRIQRDRLVAAVRRHLPSWRFRVPSGGMVLWCELPTPQANALAAQAERRGVLLATGSTFSPRGGLSHFVRLPWTQPPDVLEGAVARITAAWADVDAGEEPRPRAFVA